MFTDCMLRAIENSWLRHVIAIVFIIIRPIIIIIIIIIYKTVHNLVDVGRNALITVNSSSFCCKKLLWS